jgi:uncharacterized repeat protein (TIGR03943 family)
MSARIYRTVQSAILIGLGGFLIEKIITGKLVWYIHPRFIPLTILAVAGLLIIGCSVLWEGFKPNSSFEANSPEVEENGVEERASTGWRLAAVTLPLVIGVLIPAHPLTAAAIPGKGVIPSPPLVAGASSTASFGQSADTRNILEWNDLFASSSDPGSYLGQEANVIGFVYHDPHLKAGQFLVARFALVCCPADAFAVVMVVNWPGSASLPTDQWVKVKGAVQSVQFNGQTLPSIQATSVMTVDPPAETYLYP